MFIIIACQSLLVGVLAQDATGRMAFVMSGHAMIDSHSKLPTASFTPDSSSHFGPRSALEGVGAPEVVCTSKRVIKLATYASCDNFIVPNSTFLSMPHPSFQVHSP